MAVTSAADGSQTATVTTEHTLATITTAGVYILEVDVAALVGGATPDIVELRAKTKTRSGGTSRQVFMATFVGGLVTDPNTVSIPIATDVEVVFTLKQTQGTGRAFPWNIRKVA